ncbi:MAG: DoxX family protein [Castellaniella sp.]
MSYSLLDNLGKLVLRVSIGGMLLLHGIGKLVGGIGGIEQMVMAAGMPAIVAWGVYLGEVLAPLLMILGFYTRLGGLIAATSMVFAILLAHSAHIFSLSPMWGWAIETQGLFLFGAVAVALLGAGRYSMGGIGGRWN